MVIQVPKLQKVYRTAIALMKIMDVLSSGPNSLLFSCIITLYLLLILCLPSLLSFISAIFIIASPVLLSLFHHRVIYEPRRNETTDQGNEDRKKESCVSKGEDCTNKTEPKEAFEDTFIKWDVRAPLEVIHEVSEDEERNSASVSERCPFLSPDDENDDVLTECCLFCLPETRRMSFRLEEDETELIEFHLEDGVQSDFFAEEDGFIEIDISTSSYPCGTDLTDTTGT